MAFTEDLDAFLNEDELAVAATLQGGDTGGVVGYFDNEHLDAFGQVSTTNPVFVCKAASVVAGDVNAKTLTIAGTAYAIRDRQPIDDGAFVRLQLEAP